MDWYIMTYKYQMRNVWMQMVGSIFTRKAFLMQACYKLKFDLILEMEQEGKKAALS